MSSNTQSIVQEIRTEFESMLNYVKESIEVELENQGLVEIPLEELHKQDPAPPTAPSSKRRRRKRRS